MTTAHIATLGCPKNAVSSRRLESSLSALGVILVAEPEKAEVVIVNTCGFIDAAKEESIDCLLEMAKRSGGDSDRRLIAIGCLAERYGPELAKAMPEVDAFLGLGELERLPELIGAEGRTTAAVQAHDGGPYAYLEVSDGCDHKCSFCAIPGIRGPYRSRSEYDLLNEARRLAELGAKELVLIGQDTGAYGTDLDSGSRLPDLARQLARIDSLHWIRLMYLQWQHIDDDLIEMLAEVDKVCSYIDLPLQHASKRILRAMNRSGDKDVYLKKIDSLRKARPGIAIRTSVIVGFPGETATDSDILAEFLRDAAFDYAGVFEFSSEEGTPAALLGEQVPEEEKRERAEQIRALADVISAGRLARHIGTRARVLLERKEGDYYFGRTEHQAPEVDGETRVRADRVLELGAFCDVRVEREHDYDLIGGPA